MKAARTNTPATKDKNAVVTEHQPKSAACLRRPTITIIITRLYNVDKMAAYSNWKHIKQHRIASSYYSKGIWLSG